MKLLWIVLYSLAVTQVFYLLFLVFASWRTAKLAGRPIHWLTYVFIGPPIIGGFVLDLAWNCVFGSLLFLELPWRGGKDWTFTARLNRWYVDPTWRGKQSRFWAQLLNPFDPNHVHVKG
jgi:hypothetical protein